MQIPLTILDLRHPSACWPQTMIIVCRQAKKYLTIDYSYFMLTSVEALASRFQRLRSLSTMSLSHYDPLAGLRAFESAFSQFLNEPQTNRPWTPSVDIFETENELVLKADL